MGGAGVREQDIVKSPAKIAHEKKERIEEARKKAREKVRDGRRAAAGKREKAAKKGRGEI